MKLRKKKQTKEERKRMMGRKKFCVFDSLSLSVPNKNISTANPYEK